MLDVALHHVTFRHRSGFEIADVSAEFRASTHTAITGTAGAGVSTLLRLLTGDLTPDSGEVTIGSRPVNATRRSKRPMLYATEAPDVPGRWAVDHALVAALRDRSLDRFDRQREFALAAKKWKLEHLLPRRVDTLSSSERTLVNVAMIELKRPAILVADRLLAALNPAARDRVADELYRALRVIGTTVITAPADHSELAFSEQVVLLHRGRVIQTGSAAAVYTNPVDDAAAEAMGSINALPVTIRGNVVESPIGNWNIDAPPFQGSGLALLRPEDFKLAAAGEESDFVFGIEEAGFSRGQWIARGFLSGALVLRIALPRETPIRKGRLLAMTFDPARARLLQRAMEPPELGVPTDVIPLMRDSR